MESQRMTVFGYWKCISLAHKYTLTVDGNLLLCKEFELFSARRMWKNEANSSSKRLWASSHPFLKIILSIVLFNTSSIWIAYLIWWCCVGTRGHKKKSKKVFLFTLKVHASKEAKKGREEEKTPKAVKYSAIKFIHRRSPFLQQKPPPTTDFLSLPDEQKVSDSCR